MAVTKYVWDPFTDNVLKEKDDAGNVTASYTTEPEQFGNLISQKRSGTTSYYHYDGQGSTLALTDSNGDVTDTYAYNGFGETTASSGTTVNPYRFIGEKGYQYDSETDDYYVRERNYEPAIARWLAIDPAEILERMNRYIYVINIPTMRVDPSGKKSSVPTVCIDPREVCFLIDFQRFVGPGGCRTNLKPVYCPGMFGNFLAFCVRCLGGCGGNGVCKGICVPLAGGFLPGCGCIKPGDKTT